MPKYRVWGAWSMYGYHEIEAPNEDEARRIADYELGLPENDVSYIESSFSIDDIEVIREDDESHMTGGSGNALPS